MTFHMDTIPLRPVSIRGTAPCQTPALPAPAPETVTASVSLPSAVPAAFGFVAAHLLSLPGVAIALYLCVVGRVAGSGGWLPGLFELLFSGFVIFPVVLLCALLLLAAGLVASVRPWACIALVAVNLAALAVSWTISPPAKMQDLLIWVPCVVSGLLAGVLARRGLLK